MIIDRVVAGALDGDRAIAVAPHRVLHRLLGDLAGLVPVEVGDAADERALQVAERVAAHPLHAEPALDRLGQQVGQSTAAGQLDVAMGVALDLLGQLLGDGRAAGVVDAFRDRDDAAAEPVHRGLHVGQEPFELEIALGHVDQVRAVFVELLPQAPRPR